MRRAWPREPSLRFVFVCQTNRFRCWALFNVSVVGAGH